MSTTTTTASASATYAKLKDGTWGVRCAAGVQPGATVTVTKRSGESKVETVDRVLWTGVARDGRQASLVTLVATSRDHRTAYPVRGGAYGGSRRRGPCGYPGCDGRSFCDECSE